MPETLFSAPGLSTATSALDGLSLRQQVIGRNLANVDTPGYKAQAVSFEETLQDVDQPVAKLALATPKAGHQLGRVEPGPEFITLMNRPGGSERADGNTVDVDQELEEMAETGIQYQALSQLVSKELLLLKTIATGR